MPTNTFPQNSQPAADCTGEAIGITIIYDDHQTALHGRHFSELLTAACGGAENQAPVYWRSELIDLPGIAREIARDTAGSEFVILSLRGDMNLSMEMKSWIESWLAGAAGGPASLVVLFDADRSLSRHVESARCYLRHITASAGVAFFAHCPVTLDESAVVPSPDDEEPLEISKSLRSSRRTAALFFQIAAA